MLSDWRISTPFRIVSQVHPTNALPPDIFVDALSGAPGPGFLEEAWNPDVIEVTQKVGFIVAPANLVGPPPVDEDEIEMFLEDALNEPPLGVLLSTEMVIQADRMSGLKVWMIPDESGTVSSP